MKAFAASVLAAALFAPPVHASEFVPLGEAMIEYDPEVWSVTELSGVALAFTCIATDCEGGPQVHAATAAARDDGSPGDFFGDETWRDSAPLVDPAPRDGALPFTAAWRWSGCRARDNPILSAHAIQGGTAYHFTTGLGDGCNFGPELPEARFLELLRGLTAIGPE